MKTNSGVLRTAVLCSLVVMLSIACVTTKGDDDPLKHTRKLVSEGHASLYRNGAFQVPNTSISLIPAGPSTMEFVGELAGVRARQSFKTSIKNAAESVSIVSEGTKLTYNFSKEVGSGSREGADEIRKFSSENSTLLLYRSSDLGKSIIGKSWDVSQKMFRSGRKAGEAVSRDSRSLGDRISEGGSRQGTELASSSLRAAKDISLSSGERSGSAFAYAGNRFIKGYAAVPAQMNKRAGAMGESLTEARLGGIVKEQNEARSEWSQKTVDLMSDTVRDYSTEVSSTFSKASKEFEGSYTTTGMSLAVLKSLRWVLQGILWDATIEPIGKMTAASMGYIGVNLLAFPSMVVVQEGVATTKLAVEVTWNTAKMGYDLVAPTGAAALAALYGVLDYAGSNVAAGATAVTGTVLGYGEAGMSKVAGVVVKGGGSAAAKGVQYIGVPLASAGIAVGGGTIGTAVGAVGGVSGGALYVAGEAGAVSTRAFGNVIAGTTLVAGTAASTAGGAAYGIYELSKAVVVPAGYELGGGIVLSYGTLAHVGAHSILAVSDCAYMVLSLEGPRWVLYAVKGKTGDGEDLPVGAVVDLRKMHESGEEIYYLPVTDEEMRKVVNSVYDNLPEIPAEDK
jgi:hypothetical protein